MHTNKNQGQEPDSPQVHHIGIEVNDLFTMELFYRLVLGFRLNYRYASQNTPGLRTVFLSRGPVRLELLQRGQNTHSPITNPVKRQWGHFALVVADVDAAWQAALAALSELPGGNGENIAKARLDWREPRLTGDGWREALLFDPEGNSVELVNQEQVYTAPKVKAVIFDFDGTLADSEPNYFHAAQRLLAEFGHDYSEADNARFIGTGNLYMLKELIAQYRLPVSLEALAWRKEEIYLELATTETRAFPQVLEFLRLAQNRGLKLAVASGSSQVILDTLVRQMGLAGQFEVVLSSEAVSHGKPAPDVFLETARRLGLAAGECLVVEDSAPGVEAAIRAGMPCLAIPSAIGPRLDGRFSLADFLARGGMAEFKAQAAFDWLGRWL